MLNKRLVKVCGHFNKRTELPEWDSRGLPKQWLKGVGEKGHCQSGRGFRVQKRSSSVEDVLPRLIVFAFFE